MEIYDRKGERGLVVLNDGNVGAMDMTRKSSLLLLLLLLAVHVQLLVAVASDDEAVPSSYNLQPAIIGEVHTVPPAKGRDEDLVAEDDFHVDCELNDRCPIQDGDEGLEPGQLGLVARSHPDYSKNPYLCRCDSPECLEFGDCCRNLTIGKPLRAEANFWKCNRIIEKGDTHALMISKCPADSRAPGKDLCTARPGDIPYRSYSYLIDIPVYSNVTQYLYRNIYCARCHGEKNAGLIHWKTRLYCNENMTKEGQRKFIKNAQYVPGNRTFVSLNLTCAIYIADLFAPFPPVHEIIPNVRYCGGTDVVETCPKDDATERDSQLCSMYSQHVEYEGRIYKNPHCARCSGIGNYNGSDLTCKVHRPTLTIFKTFDVPVRPRGPQGISLLFDFSLDSEEVLVGYEMVCTEDHIWDYLHKRCQRAVCQKGYFIQDDACHPIPSELEEDRDKGTGAGGEASKQEQVSNTTCMRILIFESEFSFVSANNTSIMVNSSRSGEPIIFSPDEYEFWNDTTVAICAKDLHEGFASRFPHILDYLSTVSLALSVIFSFLHILLYLILPKLRNLPGNNLFCLTASLFVSQLIFLTLINHTRWSGLCVAASIVMHYAFLAAFFWMNVMSFDIWRTFTGAMLMSRNQTSDRKRVTFLRYSLFAWLSPLFFVLMAVTVEVLPSYLEQPGHGDMEETLLHDILERIKPSYGHNGICWISQRMSLFIFFTIPVALVVTSNLILFSFTAKAILAQRRESGKVLDNKESKKTAVTVKTSTGSKDGSRTDEVNFKLYAKLALIMGLTWILGFVSNFTKWNWLWFPFVLLNGLQGTFIFFAFDCKRKIVKMLKERVGSCWLGKLCGVGVDSSHRSGLGGKNYTGQSESGTRSRSTSISFNRTLSTSLDK